MLTLLSPHGPRNLKAWIYSVATHIAGGVALAFLGTGVVSRPEKQSAMPLMLPSLRSEVRPLKPTRLVLKPIRLPKQFEPERRTIPLPAPMAVVASAPSIALPATSITPPPQLLQTTVPAPRIVVQPAGFESSPPLVRSERQPPRLAVQEASVFGSTTTKALPASAIVRTDSGFGSASVSTTSKGPRILANPSTGFEHSGTAARMKPPVVSEGSFGNIAVAKPAAPVVREPSQHADSATPVEITFQPRPVYTDEARRLRVQGQVLVQVMFAAAGDIKILRIVSGLGNGLNESAVAAVNAIRFRPALRQGKPIDTTAMVRMNFELAF